MYFHYHLLSLATEIDMIRSSQCTRACEHSLLFIADEAIQLSYQGHARVSVLHCIFLKVHYSIFPNEMEPSRITIRVRTFALLADAVKHPALLDAHHINCKWLQSSCETREKASKSCQCRSTNLHYCGETSKIE